MPLLLFEQGLHCLALVQGEGDLVDDLPGVEPFIHEMGGQARFPLACGQDVPVRRPPRIPGQERPVDVHRSQPGRVEHGPGQPLHVGVTQQQVRPALQDQAAHPVEIRLVLVQGPVAVFAGEVRHAVAPEVVRILVKTGDHERNFRQGVFMQ